MVNLLPFDGIVTKSIVKELYFILTGGRIEKIFQPEPDEINMNIRAGGQNIKLLLSASPNFPRIHITSVTKDNPAVPPVFCMLLRKHLSGGKILGIDFIDYERIITLNVESTNELGDTSVKKLTIEIMGKHSNIILINPQEKIIDSIKHIDVQISSVREVMPARQYILPPSQNKLSLEHLDLALFFENLKLSCVSVPEAVCVNIEKYLLNAIKGFSPLLCVEACYRAEINGKALASSISNESLLRLKRVLSEMFDDIICNRFSPCILLGEESNPLDFHCLEIKHIVNKRQIFSISEALDEFYCLKDGFERLKTKKADVLKVLNSSLDRCKKKLALHQDKLREVAGREKFKLWGELITANIYCIAVSNKKVSLLNYYSETEEIIDIEMDENLSPQQNAQRYFKKYTKTKSTFVNTTKQLEETIDELEYLENVLHLLENCNTLVEINEVRQELTEQSYISNKIKYTSKKKTKTKKAEKPSPPLHFRSSEGLDIYVGKNNKQNDMLTLKASSSNDIWLHTKNIPGSHVIVKKTQQSIPESTLFEAAVLSAYHSKARQSSSVPVDYTAVKNVKKPNGAKPGKVIYNDFKTLTVTPDEGLVNRLRVED